MLLGKAATSLLQYLSPLVWDHINLTGDYVGQPHRKMKAGQFRDLRSVDNA